MNHPPKYKLQLVFDSSISIQIGTDIEPEDIAKLIKETMILHNKRDPKLPRLYTKFIGWDSTIHNVDLSDLKYWNVEAVEVKQQQSNLTIPTMIPPKILH